MVPPPVHAVLALHTDQHPGADEQAGWAGQEGVLAGGCQQFELGVHNTQNLAQDNAKCL